MNTSKLYLNINFENEAFGLTRFGLARVYDSTFYVDVVESLPKQLEHDKRENRHCILKSSSI